MKGDIIECLNCGKTFVDTTQKTDKLTEAGNTYQWTGQDSREGKFKNMCPFCYGTSTRNTHEKTKKITKFIYGSDTKGEDSHPKTGKTVIKKPNLDNEAISKEVLGHRQSYNIPNDSDEEQGNYVPQRNIASSNQATISKSELDTVNFVKDTGGTYKVQVCKSFTPIELMERKLEAQHRELLSPPDNFKRYKGWRYDKRLKK